MLSVPASAEPEPTLVSRWAPGLVFCVAVAVFLPALWVPFFHLDDRMYVLSNSAIHAPGWRGLAALWSPLRPFETKMVEFFPLRDSIYWVQWQLFGENPLPFHVTQIALHGLVAVSLLRLFRRAQLGPRVALAAALLFAVHPIHVESVAWVAALKDPLFLLFMIHSAERYLAFRAGGRRADQVVSLVLLVAGLLSKSIPITLPIWLFAFETLLEPRRTWRDAAKRVAPHAAVAAIFLAYFLGVARHAKVIIAPHGGDWVSHVSLALWAFARYVQQSLVPLSFKFHYCFGPTTGMGVWRTIVGAATVVAVVALLVRAWRRHSPLALWGLVGLAPLLPVLNVVPFPSVISDRYLYAPTVGSCVLLALLVTRLRSRALLTLCVLVLGGVTTLRSVVWQSEKEVWREATEDPNCHVDRHALAGYSFLIYGLLEDDPAEAAIALKSGIEHPTFALAPPNVRCQAALKAAQLARQAGADTAQWYERLAARMCTPTGDAPPP